MKLIDGLPKDEYGAYARRQNPKHIVLVKEMPVNKLIPIVEDAGETNRNRASLNYKYGINDGFFGSVEFLYELEKSIKKHGIKNPLEAENLDNGMYLVVCGCSRLYVCNKIGIKTVPVVIFTYPEQSNRYIPKGKVVETFDQLADDFYICSDGTKYYEKFYKNGDLFEEWWIDQDVKKRVLKENTDYFNSLSLGCPSYIKC